MCEQGMSNLRGRPYKSCNADAALAGNAVLILSDYVH